MTTASCVRCGKKAAAETHNGSFCCASERSAKREVASNRAWRQGDEHGANSQRCLLEDPTCRREPGRGARDVVERIYPKKGIPSGELCQLCSGHGEGLVDWTAMPPEAVKRVVNLIGKNTISALRQSCKHFRSAVGEACQELDPRFFDGKIISCWFPCLERLNISCCGEMTGYNLSQIHNLHHLHTLNISSTDVTCASINALTAFHGRLTDLDMHDIRNVDDACISQLSALTNLQHLNINGLRGITDEGFSALAQGLSNVKVLEMQCCGITDKAVSVLAQNVPQLEVLDIGINPQLNGRTFNSFKNHTALKRLCLDNNTQMTDDAMEAIAGITSLQDLSLDWAHEHGEGLSAFCHARKRPLLSLSVRTSPFLDVSCVFGLLDLEGLQELSLHGFTWTQQEFEILCQCTGLRNMASLEISMGNQHSQDALEMGEISNFSSLNELRLNWCDGLEDKDLWVFANTLKDLHTLCIPQCNFVSNLGVGYLAGLSGLQALDLNYTGKVTDEGLRKLNRNTTLRELHLKGLGITDAALVAFKSLHRLEWLDIGGCQDVTPFGVMELSSLQHLKLLSIQWCNGLTGFQDLDNALQRASQSLGLVVERQPILPDMDLPAGQLISGGSEDSSLENYDYGI